MNNNYTRVPAESLRTGDRIVIFDERTGDARTVTLTGRKTYEGRGDYWETSADDGTRYGWENGMEAMRCD
jgi:hypothetical protein